MDQNKADQLRDLISRDPDAASPDVYKWDDEYQRLIIAILLTDRYFLVQSLDLVEPKYFLNEAHKLICRLLFEHFDKEKCLPGKIIMRQLLLDRLKDKAEGVVAFNLGELETLYSYYTEGLENKEHLLDRIVTFAKSMAIKTAFHKCTVGIQKNPESEETWVQVRELLREAMLVDRKFDIGLDYFQTYEDRYDRMALAEEHAERFTTGFRSLDESLAGGGLSKGELGAWLALPGVGKTHLVGTKVLMFDGSIKNVEDIVVGDLVMGDDSTPRRVLNTHSLWDKVYEVKPVKGDSYYVNSKHVLSLKNSHRQGAWNTSRGKRDENPSFVHHPARIGGTNIFNISVEDWLKQSNHFKVKMKGWRTGVDWPERPVSIDPYILGLWLGDGSSNQAVLTNIDKSVISEWKLFGNSIGLICKTTDRIHHSFSSGGKRNKFCDLLRSYNLLNNKHIPNDYKLNSREIRLQLLAGLIDTDGHMIHNSFDIIQKRKGLLEDIVFIARSLGFSAYISECEKSDQNGTKGTYYRTTISGDCSEIPVRITRKKAMPRQQVKNHLLTGITVIPHNGYGRFYGFETDGNHLYLLADFTVVHNSLALTGAAVKNLQLGKRVLYISLEMDQDKIAERFDAMLAQQPITMLKDRKEFVFTALREHQMMAFDKRTLIIKQFPSGGADVNTIRAYCAQLQLYGYKPDLVIVDYVGEMKDAPGIPTWESRYRILRDLRGFGVEFGHCTLTALQPNRQAADANIDQFMDESKLGDSFNQNRPLDALWTINQTIREKNAAVARVFVAKHRNGRSRFSFKVGFDYKLKPNGGGNTLMIEQISDDNYKMLMSNATDQVADEIQIDVIKIEKKDKWTPTKSED